MKTAKLEVTAILTMNDMEIDAAIGIVKTALAGNSNILDVEIIEEMMMMSRDVEEIISDDQKEIDSK